MSDKKDRDSYNRGFAAGVEAAARRLDERKYGQTMPEWLCALAEGGK